MDGFTEENPLKWMMSGGPLMETTMYEKYKGKYVHVLETSDAFSIPVVPHKAVAEVSK